jgi:hypothetical protein
MRRFVPSPPQPRGGWMALAGRRFGCGRVGFLGATSFCRGTTHARFASEVEQKVSNLLAHSPAERSSSHSRGRAGWKRPMRREVSGIHRFESSFPSQPTRSLPDGFLNTGKRRQFPGVSGQRPGLSREISAVLRLDLKSRGRSPRADFSISGICVAQCPEIGCVFAETGSNLTLLLGTLEAVVRGVEISDQDPRKISQ